MGLAMDKKHVNASKQNSFKISEAEKWLFCGFGFFTFMQFYLFFFSPFSPFFKKIVPSFLCVSINPAVGRDPVSKVK